MSKTQISNQTIVSVGLFQGTKDKPATANKNGLMPLYLTVVSGKFPKGRNVMDGSVAERAGIEPGKMYLISVDEVDANEYGRQFNYTKLSIIGGLEFAVAAKQLGAAQEFSLETDEEKATRVAANVEAKINAEMAEK